MFLSPVGVFGEVAGGGSHCLVILVEFFSHYIRIENTNNRRKAKCFCVLLFILGIQDICNLLQWLSQSRDIVWRFEQFLDFFCCHRRVSAAGFEPASRRNGHGCAASSIFRVGISSMLLLWCSGRIVVLSRFNGSFGQRERLVVYRLLKHHLPSRYAACVFTFRHALNLK